MVVLGLATICDEEGGCAPNESEFAFIHVKLVVSAPPPSCSPITRNTAVGGKGRHSCDVVTRPKSNDHSPPRRVGLVTRETKRLRSQCCDRCNVSSYMQRPSRTVSNSAYSDAKSTSGSATIQSISPFGPAM